MVKIESVMQKPAKSKFVGLVMAGIIATVAFDVVMHADISLTGLPTNVPALLGNLVLGQSPFSQIVGYMMHLGNGIGLALLFGYVALPISQRIIKVPIWVTGLVFATVELIIAVWLVMFPALGMGIAGLDAASEIPIVTFARHAAYGLVLSFVIKARWSKQ